MALKILKNIEVRAQKQKNALSGGLPPSGSYLLFSALRLLHVKQLGQHY
jgi:hypothetical protein